MYDVLIQCSSTGRLVPTGLVVDPERPNSVPAEPKTLRACEACGRPHGWSRWTAILAAASRNA
jgi:hypothetical protein